MAEKLNAFIALYNKKAEEQLAKKTEAFEKFKNLKLEASKLTPAIDPATGKPAEIKYGSYPTFGDYINALYTDQGLNDSLFQNTATLQFNDLEKSIKDQLFKLARAPIQYRNALAIKEQGGEKYFKEVRSIIGDELVKQGPGGDLTFDFLIGANSKKSKEEKIKELYDAVEELIDRSGSSIRGPGVLSSEEFYDAIVEAGSPSPSEKKEESPINAEAAKTEGKEAGSSAINKTEGEAKAKTESPSSAITATETTEKKVESESKVVSSPEAINTSKPEEKTASTEAKKEPLKTEVQSEQKAKPVVEPSSAISAKEKPAGQEIVIGAKEINQLDATRKQEEIKQEKISSVLNKTSLTSEKKTEAQNILNRFAESRTSPAINKENKITSAEELSASFERSKAVAQELGKIGSSSPAVTAPSVSTTSTSQVSNFENTESSDATETTINQSTTSSSTTASPTTTINAPKNLTEAQQAVIDKYKEKMGILSPEQKAMSAELQKSIKIENIKAKEAGKTEPVVEKEKIAFNEKIPSSTKIDNTMSTQNTMQNLNQPIVKSESPVPVKQEPVSSTGPEKEIAASPAQSTAMDVSGMEKRLKNIEMLLNGPLKVVIT